MRTGERGGAIDRTRYFTVDRDWTLTDLSPVAAEQLGFAVGRTVWETFPDADGLSYRDNCERAVREERPVEFLEFYNGELMRLRAEPRGDELVVFYERVFRLSTRTLRSLADGLRRIEEELADHERREGARRARESLRVLPGVQAG